MIKSSYSIKENSRDKDTVEYAVKEFLAKVPCRHAACRFIYEHGIDGKEFRKKAELDRREWFQIVNDEILPGPDVLNEIAKLLDGGQKKALLSFCDSNRRRSLFVELREKNIVLTGRHRVTPARDPRNSVIRKDGGGISSAELTNIKRGEGCNFETAIRLCFGLHCSPEESERLLAAYGYEWAKGYEIICFLKRELAAGRYNLPQVLVDWHQRKQDKVA